MVALPAVHSDPIPSEFLAIGGVFAILTAIDNFILIITPIYGLLKSNR